MVERAVCEDDRIFEQAGGINIGAKAGHGVLLGKDAAVSE
jgi:hypothetical protein